MFKIIADSSCDTINEKGLFNVWSKFLARSPLPLRGDSLVGRG